METQTLKQKRNAEILNNLKSKKYTMKEKELAPLIIRVLEEANKFDEKLNNCVINHNSIQDIVSDGNFCFLKYEFGKNYDEFPSGFLNACIKLNNKFNKVHKAKYASIVGTDEEGLFFFNSKFKKERDFTRKLISKIVDPLKLKRVIQPIFVNVDYYFRGKDSLWITWSRGTKHASNMGSIRFELPCSANKYDLKLIEHNIEIFMKENNVEFPKSEDVNKIIKATLLSKSLKQKKGNNDQKQAA
jgi:hypothetical protein